MNDCGCGSASRLGCWLRCVGVDCRGLERCKIDIDFHKLALVGINPWVCGAIHVQAERERRMAMIVRSALRLLARDRRGVTSLEYAILALVGIMAMVALMARPSGGLIGDVFNSVFTAAQSVISR